ncbi:MAG: KamA family radical SAM protein [Paenibacillaceae bacterium]
MSKRPGYITDINRIESIPLEERIVLNEITEKFTFRINTYYMNLIDWNDPEDPIRKIVIPNSGELKEFGEWDASNEASNYTVPGCQHKYKTTALLLVSEVCGSYCRFCFRKRLFRPDDKEIVTDLEQAYKYIRSHEEINNVLLTGGDPFMLSTQRIRVILERLREIEHVRVIRFGSKMPIFNPMRIYEDSELLELLKEHSGTSGRIYVMAHINHPREITDEALKCILHLHESGVIVVNQSPILRGVNDEPEILSELLDVLSWAGVTPYYFFINRPVAGNYDFVLTLKQVYTIFEEAKARTSGLGKRVRLVMSHSSGKIEILAIENDTIYLKYHQSKAGDYGKLMVLPCPDDAIWFDDLPGNERFWK